MRDDAVPDGPHGIGAQAVREALERILVSPDFDATDRLRKFLRYVVEETLQGRGARIKAYSIATSVFGRDENFDPQVDSIVRIVAGRLRRSLEHYYLTSGRADTTRIQIPKGSYVPSFATTQGEETVTEASTESGSAVAQRGPSVMVEQLTQEGDHAEFPYFTAGLTRSLVVGLSRFTSLRVYGPHTEGQHEEAYPRTDYVLRGGAAIAADRFWVDIVFAEQRTGRIIWAASFVRPMDAAEIFSLRDDVASRIVQTLAQPYGIINNELAHEAGGMPPERFASYSCVLHFYEYWRTFDRNQAPAIRDCLERTIRRDPNYAEAFACLSLLYSNIYRFHTDTVPSDPDLLDRALALADRAIELAPNSSWAHYARSLAYWFLYDVDSSVASLETANALNPNDTAIMADLGQRYAMRGDWDKAVPLLEESYARNPAQPGSYRIGLFLFHYAHGRYEEALMQARKMGSLVVYGHVAVAMAAAQLGYAEETSRALRRILTLDPAYGDHVVTDMKKRSLRSDLAAMVVDGLRKAGLTGRELGGASVSGVIDSRSHGDAS